MDYYTALEHAMVEARKDSFLPCDLSREQMLVRIADITDFLKGSLSNGERIILHAERQELRFRIQRAEEIAERLMGKPLNQETAIDHIDGNPNNNHPANLRVVTLKKNRR